MASAEGVDVAVCVWAACRVRVAECEDNMLLCGRAECGKTHYIIIAVIPLL